MKIPFQVKVAKYKKLTTKHGKTTKKGLSIGR